MATKKDELVERTKEKIIELFGPESALAQAMEDDGFFEKLGDLISWLFGEIMLSQPRPEPPQRYPEQPGPGPLRRPWTRTEWEKSQWDVKYTATAGNFTHKITAAMAKWSDNYRSGINE